MGRTKEPRLFVCRYCGAERQTHRTGALPVYCGRACRADDERKGREQPSRYMQAGYWMLRWNEGGKYVYQFEHRRVWEDANGSIPDGHCIHHRNGIKTDNRLGNLELMSVPEHISHHKRKYHSRAEELEARRIQQQQCRDRRKMA